MIENHNICDFSVCDVSFEVFNKLGHRDKQVIRQCIQTFSVVINFLRSNGITPRVLETGSGLSTILFSKILSFPGEMIKTIDAFPQDAIQVNSRGASCSFALSSLKNCTIIEGITIDSDELIAFYSSPNSTLMSLSHDELLKNLDLFITLDMEDRNYQKITNMIDSRYLTGSVLRDYFIRNKLFESDLFKAYRTNSDEFVFLKKTCIKPVLRNLLKEYSPNIIYLDSGEYSSNIEFNIIDELVEEGTILIVQDIFFPKSIKSFLIASAIMASPRWKVLWIDRTTPQGIIICKKMT